MSTPPSETPRIAVVGGGLAGLAAALRLGDASQTRDRPLDITLFEAGPRLGGALATIEQSGYLIERGADAFLTKPPILELCERLGLSEELLPTEPRYRGALILRNGKPVPVPAGFQLMAPRRLWPVLASPILSAWGKLRLLGEAFVPRRNDGVDESIASFARRRLGRQTFDRLVQPLVSGIYTGDPDTLSLAATLPRFIEMERRHGSLLRAELFHQGANKAEAGGARYGQFAGPRGGMETILSALGKRVAETARVRVGTAIQEVRRTSECTGETPVAPDRAPRASGTAHGGVASGGWSIVTSNGAHETFDAVVLAVPAYVAAELLRESHADLAELLEAIPYASSAVVATGHRREDISHPLDAFGLVIPAIEQRDVLAVSFASRKFPGRAPDGRVLLRTFLGGAMRPEQIDRSDEEIIATVRRELTDLLGVRGDPEVAILSRYDRAMPQYHVGHLDRLERIEAATSGIDGLELTGAAYQGVGIPDVVGHATAAADRLMERITLTTAATT